MECRQREVNGLLDLLPFIWNDDNDSSIRNWMRFNELRGKIYDTNNGGSHDEYLEMCDALTQSVGAERSMFLSRFKRNDPVPLWKRQEAQEMPWPETS